MGKPGVAGGYTNQRLNLSKPWKGLRMTCQGFKPDPGNLAVRHYRGASRNIRNGETENPPAIERAGSETPHLQQGALDLYPNRRHHSKPATRLDPTRLPLPDHLKSVITLDRVHRLEDHVTLSELGRIDVLGEGSQDVAVSSA